MVCNVGQIFHLAAVILYLHYIYAQFGLSKFTARPPAGTGSTRGQWESKHKKAQGADALRQSRGKIVI
jgi:hypothetical protein